MSLTALERSVRATHPRCVRVNLRLWYALKAANLIEQREVAPSATALAGVLFPHFGEALLVLDPDLDGHAFEIEQPAKGPAPAPVQRRIAAPPPAASSAPKDAHTGSAFDRRWMGRY
jgi:hypothetical protein